MTSYFEDGAIYTFIGRRKLTRAEKEANRRLKGFTLRALGAASRGGHIHHARTIKPPVNDEHQGKLW